MKGGRGGEIGYEVEKGEKRAWVGRRLRERNGRTGNRGRWGAIKRRGDEEGWGEKADGEKRLRIVRLGGRVGQ